MKSFCENQTIEREFLQIFSFVLPFDWRRDESKIWLKATIVLQKQMIEINIIFIVLMTKI